MEELHIERLGQRGEGIARAANGPVYVPYALAGDIVLAEVAGERGHLVEILTASPDRIAPFCPHYGLCGGCAVQALAPAAYDEWKRGLLVEGLRRAGLSPLDHDDFGSNRSKIINLIDSQYSERDLREKPTPTFSHPALVAPLIDAQGEGRRRATFHARFPAHGPAKVGFMQARAHEVIDLDACPILAPALQTAPALAHHLAAALGSARKPLDLAITATLTGLDIDLRGHGTCDPQETQALIRLAEREDLARLSNHGARIIERRAPLLRIGRAEVTPPSGTFLQATQAGEEALAQSVCGALADARHIADLFAGLGTFSLRLAEKARVHAVDSENAALTALARAARATPGLLEVSTETRDLFLRPLDAAELRAFDAVVFDPPRAGAQAQASALAAAAVPLVVAVSCNVQSFCRDAALLTAGGYKLESVIPIDQFRYSPHLEIVGIFRRPGKTHRPRRLLG
jgi:23S rRNA (uracil1939-C5)-methyltransferase